MGFAIALVIHSFEDLLSRALFACLRDLLSHALFACLRDLLSRALFACLIPTGWSRESEFPSTGVVFGVLYPGGADGGDGMILVLTGLRGRDIMGFG